LLVLFCILQYLDLQNLLSHSLPYGINCTLTSLFQILDKNPALSYFLGVVVEHVSTTTGTGTGRQRLARV